MTVNAKAYVAMVQTHLDSLVIERYHADLFVHDAETLGCYPIPVPWAFPEGMQFGWVMRDSGTDITRADSDVDNVNINYYAPNFDKTQRRIDYVRSNKIVHIMSRDYVGESSNAYMYFWWDGETLKQVHSALTILDHMRYYQENASN